MYIGLHVDGSWLSRKYRASRRFDWKCLDVIPLRYCAFCILTFHLILSGPPADIQGRLKVSIFHLVSVLWL